MTTPRDLMIVTLERATDHPVAQGELSLALAGAELVDLLGAEDVTLDGDRIVPAPLRELDDRLLNEAAAALVRSAPYEGVDDWLWRRGRDLAAAYHAALEADGTFTRRRGHWNPLKEGRETLADSPERRRAAERNETDEPVLAALGAAVGLREEPADQEGAGLATAVGEPVATVLAGVHDAVTELEAVRQRRSIEEAAFDNIWRAP